MGRGTERVGTVRERKEKDKWRRIGKEGEEDGREKGEKGGNGEERENKHKGKREGERERGREGEREKSPTIVSNKQANKNPMNQFTLKNS